MSAQAWGSPELGLYYLRHAGRDLEIRRIPKTGKGSPEKQYQVIVDGILTDMAWSTSEGKTKAIKLAEKTHKGEPILTYAERENLKDAPEPKAKPEQAPEVVLSSQVDEAPPVADREPEPFEIHELDLIEEPAGLEAAPEEPEPALKPMGKVLAGLVGTIQGKAASQLTEAAEQLRAVPCGCAADAQAGVSFTIRGKLDIDATNALTTIRAAVELLREHGGVDCDVIVPSRIKL